MSFVACGNLSLAENKWNHPQSYKLSPGSQHAIIYQRGAAYVPTDLQFIKGLTYKDKHPCPLATRGNLDYTVARLLTASGDKH